MFKIGLKLNKKCCLAINNVYYSKTTCIWTATARGLTLNRSPTYVPPPLSFDVSVWFG